MIVVLADQLFLEAHAEDELLLVILRQGRQGRFAVKTRPAFTNGGDRPANAWIARQRENLAEKATLGFQRGLSHKAYQWPKGRREPEVILEVRDTASWPLSFDDGPARLPLDDEAEILLVRSLRLKLENEISDWSFLQRTLPPMWKNRWSQAVKHRWIEEEQGGGITEIGRIVSKKIAHDRIRGLRLWAMFDSDASKAGELPQATRRTRDACEEQGVPFHMLERRKIENYLPEGVMRAWARDAVTRVNRDTNKQKPRATAVALEAAIDRYWSLPPDKRHFEELKVNAHQKLGKNFQFGHLADIWGSDRVITEHDLTNDGWGAEREALFLSLFASL